MLQEAPPDCKPKHQQSLWETLTNYMSLDVDACTKYHQRMMTDPIWEIPPTKVSRNSKYRFLKFITLAPCSDPAVCKMRQLIWDSSLHKVELFSISLTGSGRNDNQVLR